MDVPTPPAMLGRKRREGCSVRSAAKERGVSDSHFPGGDREVDELARANNGIDGELVAIPMPAWCLPIEHDGRCSSECARRSRPRSRTQGDGWQVAVLDCQCARAPVRKGKLDGVGFGIERASQRSVNSQLVAARCAARKKHSEAEKMTVCVLGTDKGERNIGYVGNVERFPVGTVTAQEFASVANGVAGDRTAQGGRQDERLTERGDGATTTAKDDKPTRSRGAMSPGT
jgi:hypothetical protein